MAFCAKRTGGSKGDITIRVLSRPNPGPTSDRPIHSVSSKKNNARAATTKARGGKSVAAESHPDMVVDARIGIVMGSASDWETMRAAADLLNEFGIAFEARVLSAHRMPDALFSYAEMAPSRGLVAIIAGAGGAAHLPGMLAAKTIVPVLGVPVPSRYLHGQDSLYSIVQMPRGIPVATFAIGSAGAANAALFAIAIMARDDATLATRLVAWRAAQTEAAMATRLDG